MGRMYSAVFEEVAVTAIQDLFEIVAAADSVVKIHGFSISQSTDAGDSESEQLNVLMHRGSTSGSAGSSVTPSPLNLGDSAYGGTVEANNTTQGTEGIFLGAWNFNVMAGLDVWYTPETRPVLSPSGRMIIELQTAPADSITMSGTVYLEEIGG